MTAIFDSLKVTKYYCCRHPHCSPGSCVGVKDENYKGDSDWSIAHTANIYLDWISLYFIVVLGFQMFLQIRLKLGRCFNQFSFPPIYLNYFRALYLFYHCWIEGIKFVIFKMKFRGFKILEIFFVEKNFDPLWCSKGVSFPWWYLKFERKANNLVFLPDAETQCALVSHFYATDLHIFRVREVDDRMTSGESEEMLTEYSRQIESHFPIMPTNFFNFSSPF